MLQAGRDQLAAPNAPPALTGKFDLAVRMHESLVGNLSQAVLGGVTLTDERLVEIIKDATGKVPEELAITEEDDPWSITFASELPIEVRFQRANREDHDPRQTVHAGRPGDPQAGGDLRRLLHRETAGPGAAGAARRRADRVCGPREAERLGHRDEDLHEKEVRRAVQAGDRLRGIGVARAGGRASAN